MFVLKAFVLSVLAPRAASSGAWGGALGSIDMYRQWLTETISCLRSRLAQVLRKRKLCSKLLLSMDALAPQNPCFCKPSRSCVFWVEPQNPTSKNLNLHKKCSFCQCQQERHKVSKKRVFCTFFCTSRALFLESAETPLFAQIHVLLFGLCSSTGKT